MKKNYVKQIFLLGCILTAFTATLLGQTITTFSYTGSMQTFTVPPCVGTITVDLTGAQGANAADKLTTNSTGGLGGRAQGVLTVTPGQVLNIFVGGVGNTNGNGGFNGGGAGGLSSAGSGACNGGYAGGGGGASDIRVGGIALANRVIVGGGGGGSGRDYCNGTCLPCGCGGSGGAGGGLLGGNGFAATNCGFGYPGTGGNFGAGATATTGGLAGQGDNGGPNGTAGVLGVGGTGGTGGFDVAGGGGGGGYYGGGGGGSASSGSGVGGGGGGGGSSYVVGLTNGSTTQSVQAGDGQVTITYTTGIYVNITSSSPVICSGSSATLSVPGLSLYNWSNASTNSSIVVSPTSNTSYSLTGMSSLGCPVLGGFITLTVSGGLPVLSVVSSTNQTCLGKTATLTASGALTYTWSNSVTNGVSFNPSVTTTYTVSGQNGCGTTTAVTTISVAPIAVNMLITPTLVCAGKTATINAAAAATSYTWLPLNTSGASNSLVVSPQVNTTYTTVVSDGTCSGIGTISIATNPNPTITVSATSSMVCQGDPVTITVTGGNNYTWTPGNLSGASVTVNPTAPTAYVVIGDNSFGCTSSTNQVVITNPSPTVVLSANTNFICSGDPVTITVSGASSYLWGGSGATSTLITVNPTSSTVYSCTGTASNCSSTQTIDIAVFDPTLAITGPASLCEGVTSTLTVSGGGTYTWSTGSNFASTNITPTANTVYTVSALTNSVSITCPSAASFQVLVLPNPVLTAVPSRSAMCRGESVNIIASGANSYVWSNTTTTTGSIVVTSSLITTLNYTVTGTNTQGCSTSTVVQVKVNSCNAIKENLNGNNQLSIYPNPNSGNFTIGYTTAIELNLVNELGQLVKTISLNASNNYQTSVSNLAKGVYFVTGQKNNALINQKLIVN